MTFTDIKIFNQTGKKCNRLGFSTMLVLVLSSSILVSSILVWKLLKYSFFATWEKQNEIKFLVSKFETVYFRNYRYKMCRKVQNMENIKLFKKTYNQDCNDPIR